MNLNEYNQTKIDCTFITDLPKKKNQKTKKYTFTKSLELLIEDISFLHNMEYKTSTLKEKRKIISLDKFIKEHHGKLLDQNDLLVFTQINIEFTKFMRKFESLQIDTNNKIYITDTILYEALNIKIFRTNVSLMMLYLLLLKYKYKIISHKSQDLKISSFINANGNPDYFLNSDVYYFDKVIKTRDALIDEIKTTVDTLQKEKLFFIYLKLFTVKNYFRKDIKKFSAQNFKLIEERKQVVFIYLDDEIVKVQFFEPLLNNLLIDVFYNDSTNLFDHPFEIKYNESFIKEYIKNNFQSLFKHFKNEVQFSNEKSLTAIKKIIKNNVYLDSQFENSSFFVTLLRETIYPHISYSELITLYPNLYDEYYAKFEKMNIEKQRRSKAKVILWTDDYIKNILMGKVALGDEEELDVKSFIRTNFLEYQALLELKSFTKGIGENENNKNKVFSYLEKFNRNKYGRTLGELITKVQKDYRLKLSDPNEIIKELIFLIETIHLKDTQKLVDYEEEQIRTFYSMFEEIINLKDVLVYEIDLNNRLLIILEKTINDFNNKTHNLKYHPFSNTLVFEMYETIEEVLLKSRYLKETPGKYATSTIYGMFSILFNHCFRYIVTNNGINDSMSTNIKKNLESIEVDNNKTYQKYKNIINIHLSKYDREITLDSKKIKFANKSLIFLKEVDAIIEYFTEEINTQYTDTKVRFVTNKNRQYVAFYLLLFYTGAREIELLSRLSKDLFISGNKIFLDVNLLGMKGVNDEQFKSTAGKRRISAIINNDEHLELIKNYLIDVKRHDAKFLFPYKNEDREYDRKKMQNASFLNTLNKKLQEILITNNNQMKIKRYISLHSFRHSYSTYSVNTIFNQNPTQQRKGDFINHLIKIGHGEPNVTFNYYTHLDLIIHGLL